MSTAKGKVEKSSIHPTIGICGTQKKEAFDLHTSPNLGVSDVENANAGLPPNALYISNSKNKLLEKHSITGYGTPKYFQGKYAGGAIKIPCPFCLKSNMLAHGKRYVKKNQNKIKRFVCLNCGKSHSLSRYFRLRTPDYVVNSFIDILITNKFKSSRAISKELKKMTKFDISHVAICSWRKKYNKGKLYDFYIPNSRLNKINKPKRTKKDYIPKEVKYKMKCHNKIVEGHLAYNKDRLKKAKESLIKHNKKIVKAKIIREAGNYSKFTRPKETLLLKQNYINNLGNGFYYINLE